MKSPFTTRSDVNRAEGKPLRRISSPRVSKGGFGKTPSGGDDRLTKAALAYARATDTAHPIEKVPADLRKTRYLAGCATVAKWLGLCWSLLVLGACGLNQKGMVMMTDPAYRATIIGTQQDGFTVPDGILWKQGKFFMADEGGGALRVWSSASEVKTLCDTTLGIQSPEDLVMDSEGNVFFTDDDAGGVWEVEHTGKAFLLAGKNKGLASTEGIALAPTGELLVGDGVRHQVYSVTRSGEVSVFLGPGYGITKPESMVFDEKGNLYIADNEDQIVYLLTPNLKLQRLIENRASFSPETIWYANHTLYITDSQNGKLSRFTPEEGLKTIAVFGGKLSNICGLTMDEQNNIYVSIQTDLKRKLGYLVKLEHEPLP